MSALDPIARGVVQRYTALQPVTSWQALGNRGGFSGACLWRAESPRGPLCIRAWPPGNPSAARLNWLHGLMRCARTAGLHFVPELYISADGASFIEQAGRLWELTSWLPGHASFREQPSAVRLEDALRQLALLHAAWEPIERSRGPCPAVQRRLETLQEWRHLRADGLQLPARASTDDAAFSWAARAWRLLSKHLERIPAALAPWMGRSLFLQPCLCDIWHAHVLYEGERVTGVLDYGSVKVDHIAVDLARLLGSMVADDRSLRQLGLRTYSSIRPLSWDDEALIGVLDWSGTLLGIANWLKWLYADGRVFEDRAAVAMRLKTLVERVESWPLA